MNNPVYLNASMPVCNTERQKYLYFKTTNSSIFVTLSRGCITWASLTVIVMKRKCVNKYLNVRNKKDSVTVPDGTHSELHAALPCRVWITVTFTLIHTSSKLFHVGTCHVGGWQTYRAHKIMRIHLPGTRDKCVCKLYPDNLLPLWINSGCSKYIYLLRISLFFV